MDGDTHASLGAQIRDEFPWLEGESCFVLIDDAYEPHRFGDCVTRYTSTAFQLRITRDREQVFAECASREDEDNWWDVRDVVAAYTGREAPGELDLSTTMTLIADNFYALREAMADTYPTTRALLRRRGAQARS